MITDFIDFEVGNRRNSTYYASQTSLGSFTEYNYADLHGRCNHIYELVKYQVIFLKCV